MNNSLAIPDYAVIAVFSATMSSLAGNFNAIASVMTNELYLRIASAVALASYSATRTTAYTSCTSVRRSVVAASRPAASPASFSRPTAASSASLPESPSFATAKTASLAAA